MKRWILSIIVMVLLVGVLPAAAQEEEATEAESFVYAIYFECDVAREDEVDEIVKNVTGPAWDQAVADGDVASWGWLGHHTGGSWRRLLYIVGDSPDSVMDALETVNGGLADNEEVAAFGEICNSHVDYIWRQAASSVQSATEAPGNVGISVYYECDFNEEEFADTLVETFFAPIYDGQVESGGLTSWSWLQHRVGGKYRRALAMRGADRTSLMAAWGEIVGQLGSEQGGAMRAFSNICYSHQDYIWVSGD